MNLTALETSNLFGVSREAIRSYSLEFADYLSPVARPQKGRQRMFTPDDLEVIAYVIEQKAEGKLFADIRAGLANGQRSEVPPAPAALTTKPAGTELALQNQITDLRTQLDQERALRHKAEGQVEQLEKQLDKLLDRLLKREG